MSFRAVPSIKITGSSSVNVYNHKGIRHVSDDCIELSSSIGPVCIDGRNMRIIEITSEFISVEGKIYRIYYKD